MATTRKGYPAVPAKIWLALREKFYTSPPKGDVTSAYLANALGLGPKVAANVMPSLKQVGLVDENNKMTPLAHKWREDSSYGAACQEILDTVYPDALKDVSPPDAPSLDAAQRWFMGELNSGADRAGQVAAFYVMVAARDIGAAADRASRRGSQSAIAGTGDRTSRPSVAASGGKGQPPSSPRRQKDEGQERDTHQPAMPSLSVAVQVYVDKDMTADQVDHVFASMAKHLYGRG